MRALTLLAAVLLAIGIWLPAEVVARESDSADGLTNPDADPHGALLAKAEKKGRQKGRSIFDPPREYKNPAGAWALEFFIGFGSGHYYAGNMAWGIAGTVSSVVEVVGLVSLVVGWKQDNANAMWAGWALAVTGEAGHLACWIAAPIVTIDNNYRIDHPGSAAALAVREGSNARIFVPLYFTTF